MHLFSSSFFNYAERLINVFSSLSIYLNNVPQPVACGLPKCLWRNVRKYTMKYLQQSGGYRKSSTIKLILEQVLNFGLFFHARHLKS